jgi:peroxiredoxin
VDSPDTNAAWAKSLEVENLLLLSDFWPHGEVAQQYGVLRPQGYTERATFIVDKKGIIRYAHIYDINELPDNEPLFGILQEINQ